MTASRCCSLRVRQRTRPPDVPQLAPPAVDVLAGLATRRTAGLTLHRVHRVGNSAWFFASTPAQGNRFDLPAPDGSCYTATSAIGAVLETFQHLEHGLLPDQELRGRRRLEVVAPEMSPAAANLTAARARGAGVTLELFTTPDRPLTQRWAEQLRRAGHRALLHPLRHDPTGRLRGVTLFDRAGAHLPYDSAAWTGLSCSMHDDAALRAGLARYALTVERSDPDLPVLTLEDSGLLGPAPQSGP